MQVTPTTFTVAEFCQQLQGGGIRVNKDYQRSPKVWPPAARSYLIDTILREYPMPKLSLHQKTDLRSRKTIKDIVDGQQRSTAIADFYNNKLRLTGKTEFRGKTFDELEEPQQESFLRYALSVDLFVGATEEEIREVFRRINSYTLPLNDQEKRHATFQGQFKWFIVECVEKYADLLKRIGVFSETQLSRMKDASFITEFAYAVAHGIDHASEAKLNAIYKENETEFPLEAELRQRLESAFQAAAGWEDLHGGPLMRSYNAYSLLLAKSHRDSAIGSLNNLYRFSAKKPFDEQLAITNLTYLASALEEPQQYPSAEKFVAACSKATNRKTQREDRFKWFCKALEHKLLE
jgi:hypothetical protein